MIKSIFRQMSPEEMKIESIKDIKMIHIYDLTGSSRPDGKYGVTAMLVNYGENLQQNLSENDYCFDSFVNKVIEVYNTSEDKSLIVMDETTRCIMEAGSVPRHDSLLREYYEDEKRDMPILVYASTLSKRFGSLVEYLVSGLYKTMGTEVEVIDRKDGWRGSGRLIIRAGETNRTTYFKTFQIDDSTFSIKLNGFLADNGDFLVNVNLYNDELSISYKSDSAALEGSCSFKFSKENLCEMHQIQKDGEQIFYDVNIYENEFSEESNIEEMVSVLSRELLPEGLRPCAVYSLPMGLDFLLYDIEDSTEQMEIKSFCGVFLWQAFPCADIRGWTIIKSLKSGLMLKNEAFRLIKMIGNREYIQTAFLAGTGSRYKKELEGKFVIKMRKSE